MQEFNDWLYETGFSTALRETSWMVPGLQTIHILAIAVLAVSALVSNLRLVGAFATDTNAAGVIRTYGRGFRMALAVLLVSGSLLIVIEPGRTLGNTTFWIKIALVVTAIVLTVLTQRGVKVPDDGAPLQVSPAVKIAAGLCLLLWVAVIFCGRWIAYT